MLLRTITFFVFENLLLMIMMFLQLPALILPGITLVVSPLVALMVDQLRKLPPVIPGGLISSSQVIRSLSCTQSLYGLQTALFLF